MTLVHFRYRKPSATGADVPEVGALEFRLLYREEASGIIRTIDEFGKTLVAGDVDVELSPTAPGQAWRVRELAPIQGRRTTYYAIPNTTSIDATALVKLDAASLIPTVDTVAAWNLTIPLTQKGAANGVATLGSDSKLSASQLPALSITDVYPVPGQTEMLALTAQRGDVAIWTNGRTFMLSADTPSVLSAWIETSLSALQKASNLSDLPSPSTARTNLGVQAGLTTTAVKTSAYTTPGNEIVLADTTIATFTVTLPTAPANGTRVIVKLIASAGTVNALTVTVGGSDHVNTSTGPTSFNLVLLNQAVTLQYAAGVWVVSADDLPLSQLDGRYVTPVSLATEIGNPATPGGTALSAAITATASVKGPTLPTLATGTEYVWLKTDGAGTLLDIVSGIA